MGVEVSLRRNDELQDEWSARKIYLSESEIQLQSGDNNFNPL